MGITIATWQNNFIESLNEAGLNGSLQFYEGAVLCPIFKGTGSDAAPRLIVNLIPVRQHPGPESVLNLRNAYLIRNIQLIQLWEDVWLSRPAQVISRIMSLLGLNQTIHGRKTKVITISKNEADEFFARHHLQGNVLARHKYALVAGGEIVAAASFSAKRNMTRRAEGYTSVELIRFATKSGFTIQGGLSKLIRHHIKVASPNDIMTYTDMDWSYGAGYDKLGFTVVDQSPPAEIWLHEPTMTRYFPHRLPEQLREEISAMSVKEADDYMLSHHYLRIFNTGSVKLILPL